MILQCALHQPSLSMHFVCSTHLGTEPLSKQTLCCVPCCRLSLCTPLPQGNFKPFLAAKGKRIPRSYPKQSRSSPHIELRATAEQPSQQEQEVYEYITLFKVTYCMNVQNPVQVSPWKCKFDHVCKQPDPLVAPVHACNLAATCIMA